MKQIIARIQNGGVLGCIGNNLDRGFSAWKGLVSVSPCYSKR